MYSMSYNSLRQSQGTARKNYKIFRDGSMDADAVEQQIETKSQTNNTAISVRQFYQHDPLLVLLKATLHLNDLWIIAGAMVLPGGLFLGWWLGWASQVSTWTIGNTLSVLLQTFILFPLLFMLYLRTPLSIARFFNTLRTNRVIGEHHKDQQGTETYENFVHLLVSWMDRNWWTLATLAIVTLYALYRLLLLEPQSLSPVPYWFRAGAIVVYLPLMYATSLSVIRLLLALVFTNLLFSRFTVQVRPLHPDGSGGLGALTSLLWLSVGIMLWDTILLSASWLSRNLLWLSPIEMSLLGAIYIALTPVLLIGWLVLPHQVMMRARDEVLQPIADEFQQALVQCMPSAKHDTRTITTGTRRLAALKERYDLVCNTFPVWPLGISAVNRLVITVILPALLPLILPALASLITLASHTLRFP